MHSIAWLDFYKKLSPSTRLDVYSRRTDLFATLRVAVTFWAWLSNLITSTWMAAPTWIKCVCASSDYYDHSTIMYLSMQSLQGVNNYAFQLSFIQSEVRDFLKYPKNTVVKLIFPLKNNGFSLQTAIQIIILLLQLLHSFCRGERSAICGTWVSAGLCARGSSVDWYMVCVCHS